MRALGNLHSQGAVLEQTKERSSKPSITFPTFKRNWKSLLDVTHHEEHVGHLLAIASLKEQMYIYLGNLIKGNRLYSAV
jgi:hypothetical protein